MTASNTPDSKHPARDKELTRENAYSVADWRALNEVQIPRTLLITAPIGFLIPSLFAGAWILAGIFLVLAVAGVFVFRAQDTGAGATASREDYREGDFPPLVYAAPIVGFIAPGVLAPLKERFASLSDLFPGDLSGIELPELAGPLLGGVYLTAIFTFTVQLLSRREQRIARRRARKALAKSPLEGVTTKRIEAVEQHQRIVNALIAVGCGPGMSLNAGSLSRLLGEEPEAVAAPLRELERAGIVKLLGAKLFDDPRRWTIAFTEDGVRCIEAARNR